MNSILNLKRDSICVRCLCIMGILPIYWKLIGGVSAFEILAYRIVLSMIFMILMIVVLKKSQTFKRDLKHLFSHPIELIVIIIAGYVITINWGTFIWAVSNGHVLQSSLGYYINPLVSILAFIFLKERFNKFETLAIIFATIGVLYMTIRVGEFPVISLMLAFSFGIYGLLKKIVKIEAISSIAIECIVTAPAGLIYMIYLWNTGTSSVGLNMDTFWLMFSGAVTAIPLILFSAGAKRIPLSLTGFIQYVGPTIMFF